ncbi:hypothetical protein OG981_53205 [Streptomyces mirabilis]|uniref:hypothetical protein n=1 Tax=Streptomyces mirabilis TaxID=68239 RepID=UPI002E20F051
MELTGRSEMAGPPVGLRAARRRLLRLAGGLKPKDAVEHPLLRGRQLVPADPLREVSQYTNIKLHTVAKNLIAWALGQPLPEPVGQELDAAVQRRSHRGEAQDQPE